MQNEVPTLLVNPRCNGIENKPDKQKYHNSFYYGKNMFLGFCFGTVFNACKRKPKPKPANSQDGWNKYQKGGVFYKALKQVQHAAKPGFYGASIRTIAWIGSTAILNTTGTRNRIRNGNCHVASIRIGKSTQKYALQQDCGEYKKMEDFFHIL